MTMDLLFPEGDHVSKAILEREVAQRTLDPYFLKLSDSSNFLYRRFHENPREAVSPLDVQSLYEKYPYWGERLHILWKEADDPSPITKIGRWAESKKNPRFTYWCFIISISVAVLFGIVATGLAGVQVWIAYCAWIDDPTKPQCWYKPLKSVAMA